jgi:hypothetical protein
MPFNRDDVNPDDLIFQRDFTRHLIRHWLKHLSGCEAACVLFIFDRTIQWGKLHERIPLRHFTDGIVSRDLKVYSEGVNFSRRQVSDSLKRLEAGKLIEVFSVTPTAPKTFGIRIETTEDELKIFSKMKKIATPKRKKNADAETASVDDLTDAETAPTDAETAPYKRSKEKQKQKSKEKKLRRADTRQTLSSVEERIEQKQKEREAKRAEYISQNRTLLKKELSRFWRDTIANYHDDMRSLQLNVAQTSALYGKQKKFVAAMHSESFVGFIDFSIAQWHNIIESTFHWMNDAPDLVDAWFFLKHFDKFFAIYEKRDRLLNEWQQADDNPMKEDVEAEVVRRERQKLEAERQKLEIERRKGRRVAKSAKKRDLSKTLTDGEFEFKEDDEQ